MRADGSVIIDTKIIDGGLEKGFDQLKSKMNSVGVAAEKMGDQIKLSFTGDASAPIQNAVARVQELQQKLEVATEGFYSAVYADDDKGAEMWGAKRESAYMRLEAAQRRLTQVVAAESEKQAQQQDKAFRKATKSARSFGKRLSRIVSSALLFSLVAKALRKVTEYMGKALKTDQQFTETSNKMQGALLTAFQPLYETILPAIISSMEVIAKYALMMGRFFSAITGKNAEQMRENASALYDQANATEAAGDAAKKAKGQIAGFDEINSLQNQDNTGTADFNLESIDMNSKLNEMVAYTSSALLAIGLLLTVSGVNVPLGISMIALGAAGLYQTVAENWGAIASALNSPLGAMVGLISGAALVAIGILLLSVSIPLGIAFIAMGAAAFAGTIAVNWNSIIEALRGPVGEIIALVMGSLVVLGIILCCVGVWPLGIGLIVAGAAGLAPVVAANWNAIVEKVKEMWSGVKSFWKQNIAPVFTVKWWKDLAIDCGNGLISGFEWAINGIISAFESMINWIVNGLNKIQFDVPDWIPGIGGKTFGFNIPEANLGRVSIPRLAKGMVIPPNKEFMAVLGDQHSGTNIEAPLETIEEAVARVTGDQSDRMIAALYTLIDIVEQKDLNVNIGDDDIGRANARYTKSRGVQVNSGAFANAY